MLWLNIGNKGTAICFLMTFVYYFGGISLVCEVSAAVNPHWPVGGMFFKVFWSVSMASVAYMIERRRAAVGVDD